MRFLAATGADLRERVKSGAFRDDLFYRLAGMEIRLPPLRQRKEDIALLAHHFLVLHAHRLERPAPDLAPAALRLLEDQPWPGNVRELEALILRALATVSLHGPLGAKEIRPLLPEAPSSAAPRTRSGTSSPAIFPSLRSSGGSRRPTSNGSSSSSAETHAA